MAIKIKDEYLLYFGCGNICGAYRSKDLRRWEDCTLQMVPLPGYRHGTVIEIPGTLARRPSSITARGQRNALAH